VRDKKVATLKETLELFDSTRMAISLATVARAARSVDSTPPTPRRRTREEVGEEDADEAAPNNIRHPRATRL